MVDRDEVVGQGRASCSCVPGPGRIAETPAHRQVPGRPTGCSPLAVEFVECLGEAIAVEPDDLPGQPALQAAHTQPCRDVVTPTQPQLVKTQMRSSDGDQSVDCGRRISADGVADQRQVPVGIEVAERVHQTHL